jgi:YggT family protein
MTSAIGLLALLIQIYLFIVLVRVIFSFVSPFPTNAISRLAWDLTEPVLAPIRRLLPPMSGIDLSPMVVWFAGFIVLGVLRSVA